MQHVMKDGKRLPQRQVGLDEARSCARREIDRLPAHIRGLEPARPPYRVDISQALSTSRDQLQRVYAT
jgi:nicotinate phosphoribosyltransferase